MEHFNNVLVWTQAHTIPILQGFAQHLSINIPKRMRKDQQIAALITGITARYPDITGRVAAFNATYTKPSSGRVGVGWYRGLVEHLVGRLLPSSDGLPLPNEEPVMDGKAPVKIPLPYTMDQFIRWLLQDPNRVSIDVAGQLALFRAQSYGTVGVHNALRNFTITPSDVIEIQNTPGAPVLSSMLMDSLNGITPDDWNMINGYLNIIMLTGQPSAQIPVIAGFPKVGLFYDRGKDPKQEGGFPRLTFSNNHITWSTAPFGLHHCTCVQLIIHVGLTPVADYSLFNAMPWNPERARKLVYRMAMDKRCTWPTIGNSTPHDFPLHNIKLLIPDFPGVMRILFGKVPQDEMLRQLDATVIVRQFSEGARWRLFRYLATHPEIAKHIPDPHTGNLPYAIEDYIPEDVWALLPIEITRYLGAPITVSNPYASLLRDTLTSIGRDRDTRLTRGQEYLELNGLDEVYPTWRANILCRSLDVVLTLQRHEQLFFMATRGFHEDRLPTELTLPICKVLIAIADAGGVGDDEKVAIPLYRPFVNDIINSLPERQQVYQVCRAFNIEGYELLTTDQIKDLFTRGYINPLPLSEEVKARYALWQGLTQEKKYMLADMYGFPVTNIYSFVTRKSIEPQMEAYIRELSPEKLPAIIKQLGLVVPAIVDPMTYTMAALPSIRDLFKGRKPGFRTGPPATVLPQLTDTEIIQAVKVTYAYRSRQDLIIRGIQLLNHAVGFFIPVERKCINPITYDFTSTKDTSVYMVAYGTLNNYACYQLGELALGFAPYGETTAEGKGVHQSFRIPKPLTSDTDKGGFLSLTEAGASELKDLIIQLVPEFKGVQQETAEALLKEIEAVEQTNRGTNDYDKARYKDFLGFPSLTREAIRDYLMQVFLCGMYMRRWMGPGTPYPLSSAETRAKNFDPQTRVYPHLEKIQNTMATFTPTAATFIQSLREVEHRRGGEQQSGHDQYNFKELINKVIEGYCIRMGSTRFIGTGAHYLTLFFNTSIPGYDLTKIEDIA